MTASGDETDEQSLLRARAAQLAALPDDQHAVEQIDVVPFTVGGELYAVPSESVREVRRLGAVVRLPRAPRALLGVTRVRSSVIPLFDLFALLHLREAGGPSEAAWVVVLERPEAEPLSVAVDTVDGVRQQLLADILPIDSCPWGIRGVTAEGLTVLDSDQLLAASAVYTRPDAAGSATTLTEGTS